ncbi:MAG TPA: cupin domain-containing protein [Gemmatimonadaceae bacterium]
MSSRILPLVAVVALALTATPSRAQQHAQHAEKAAKLSWGPAPPFLPAGAKFAIVSGDPSKSGPYEVELSLPNGYLIPPHTHPTPETVTVKSGHFVYGMGDKVNAKTEKTMNPGQSGTLPINTAHYAHAKGPTVIAVSGNGPFAMNYVNPADDPRKKK